MTIETIVAKVGLGIAGGFANRFRGGNVSWPRPLKQALVCLIYLLGIAAHVDVILTMISFGMATLATCAGHGQYFLNRAVKAVSAERLDFLVKPFFGKDPRTTVDKYVPIVNVKALMVSYGMTKLYWRNVFGLSVTGFVITLFPGLALATVSIPLGIVLILSGTTKGPIYMISHLFPQDTEYAETITGVFFWSIAADLYFWVL